MSSRHRDIGNAHLPLLLCHHIPCVVLLESVIACTWQANLVRSRWKGRGFREQEGDREKRTICVRVCFQGATIVAIVGCGAAGIIGHVMLSVSKAGMKTQRIRA